VARATALLAGHRLVSLVGAGGAGKTRLATELAARGSTALGGRVWFVELAPVRDGVELSDLLPAVLSALDVREIRVLDTQPAVPRPPVDRLVDLFIGAPALLVLDNCEHLVGAAAGLADVLLGRCPQLSVLATSREPLAITGEALHWVGPLELPVDLAPLAEARAAPAVRLFTDRAAAARPGFVLDEPNLAQVTEICRRLDGMPLALELAAARLRSMTPGQVAERLDDRFRLLTGGNRTSLPRHRTLHGVVEWSWELLTEPERTLARRLAVLSGGADTDAAVGVCSDADLAAEDVPYLLASLVEKSLLAVGEGVDGRPRYRMLETVRAYGLRELAQTGETRRLSAAFVRYFTEFAERVEPALRTADQLDAMARLGAEHDNVIAALGAAADARDAESTARLVGAMIWYWMLVGNSDEAMLWLRNAAALPAERESPATVGVRLATFLGENLSHLSRERFDVYWEGCRRAGVPERYPVAALVEPIVRIRQGDVDGALASARRIGEHRDPWARAAGRLAVCVVAVHMADVETADVELHAALAEFRALGERWGIAFSLGLLGQYLLISGDSAGAVAAHEEAVRVGGELGAFNLPPMQLIQLGAARGRAGDLDGAERDVRAALDGWAGVQGDLQLMALCVLVHIAVSRGDLDTAHELAAEAEATPDGGGGSGHGDPQLVAVLAVAKSRIALAEDDLDAAAAHLARALELSMPILDMSSVAGIGERISMVVARRGAPAEAARLLGASAGVRGLLDRGEPDVIALLTDLTDRLGPSGFEQAYSSGFELERDVAVAALRDAVSGHPAVVEVHGQGEEHRDDADQPRH
jgi:predicted ATPase